MDWNIDRKAKKPIYKQIAEFIENGIADGTFPPDKQLPSERYLAKELNINRSTVVAAYDELESIGLIQRNRGSGTTISKDIWGITKKRIPSWSRYIEAGSFLPNLPVAQRIRKEMEEQKLINLASGELSEDLFPVNTLREITSTRSFIGRLGYDHPQGNAILRTTITKHVKELRNIETNPSSILITSGAQQALHLVVQCLLKPGDAVVIEDPSYHYNLPIFKSAGLKIFYLPVNDDGLDPSELLELHKKHRIRMIFLNPAFQNPTGTLLKESQLKAILEISSEHGIPVVEDDPYSLTPFKGEEIATLKSLDKHGNVLYISSLSKVVASGLRIGWIIGPRSVIERLSDAKQQIDFGHASFTQWIANDFLESAQFHSHIKNLVKELESRRNQIVLSFNDFLKDQVEFTIPQGGIHIWIKLKRDVDEMKLLENSIKRGLIYVPGSMMGSKKYYARFTFARENEETIKEGIKRFADALNSTR
ncbi:PLP-dependent aminotransferase family protein [Bacillus sp. DTU_2020_1000418_1_SI_GHA_SEK_038]|uniref:MocR-like pyridoxine biosynthesis transcription factor PdxR n=1 Tax=Bacillus sp. DTU_2020_1000418_1_SI_GHA_SEK_038 TaxID=3077585 RepID=UPI0028ECE98B|nr:PLP-dependent aminotransferase family protein [Bacillus sp. DTU_2020_1000418_1_SI_GHA_SEK_038]WNS74994.1 PLP-dependent aminotransferase family protein [Bacillus sp. DTU_2020_1000418_1_SI_GHA_SEK_038]